MVGTVSGVLVEATAAASPASVVEIVGPAGSGKTALLAALNQRSDSILVGDRPRVRRIQSIPFFVRNMISLLPVLLRTYRNGARPTRQEMVMLARLKGWHLVLGQQASKSRGVIILDQGPVFILSWLSEFGPDSLKDQIAEDCWNSVIEQWAAVLDMVVCLDAPDAVLIERINARSKSHTVKGMPRRDIRRFLGRGRASMDAAISRLAAGGGPAVLRFDTARRSPDQIADELLAAFGLSRGDG